MAGLDKTRIQFAPDGGAPTCGNIAVGAASVSGTIPAGIELINIVTSGNAHFRISSTGAATALATDPMVTAGTLITAKLDGAIAHTIAVIQDGASTGTFCWYQVFEG